MLVLLCEATQAELDVPGVLPRCGLFVAAFFVATVCGKVGVVLLGGAGSCWMVTPLQFIQTQPL
jgi:hypothetical protein